MHVVLILFWMLLNTLLFVFILHELYLLISALIAIKKNKKRIVTPTLDTYPEVCIQLPIYNEKHVVVELINCVLGIKYPAQKLTIQILDDSTDETTAIIASHLASLNDNSGTIEHVRRSNREGFKAGALAHGMDLTTAEFFAIFDADFLPDPNFLLETLPKFKDNQVGVVQSRWGHNNESYSILTRAEGLMLDAHFSIEQLGRHGSGHFLNFNGTAGIWRRSCIDDAGGWQGDTLTEDLDLSFRAQIKKWKIDYLFHVISPAELPLTFNAYRNQQYRWSKGAAECFKKNAKKLWIADIGLGSKVIGTFHLLNSSLYIVMFLLLLTGPWVFYAHQHTDVLDSVYFWITSFGMLVNLLLIVILFTGRILCGKKSWRDILYFFPTVFAFFAFSLGIATHMAFGVIQGFRSIKSEFVRTPKFGKDASKRVRKLESYGQKSEFNLSIIESILLLYGFFWLYIGIASVNVFMIFYSILIIVGFSISLFFKNNTFKLKRNTTLEPAPSQ